MKFAKHSLVQILGYNGVYEVIGYHRNIYFTKGMYHEYNRYQLQDVKTKRVLSDFFPEDHLYYANKPKISKGEFDLLLDEYNSNMFLYGILQEDKYIENANKIMNAMKLYKVEGDI